MPPLNIQWLCNEELHLQLLQRRSSLPTPICASCHHHPLEQSASPFCHLHSLTQKLPTSVASPSVHAACPSDHPVSSVAPTCASKCFTLLQLPPRLLLQLHLFFASNGLSNSAVDRSAIDRSLKPPTNFSSSLLPPTSKSATAEITCARPLPAEHRVSSWP